MCVVRSCCQGISVTAIIRAGGRCSPRGSLANEDTPREGCKRASSRICERHPGQAKNLACRKVCSQVQGFKARSGDLHMCAPGSIRSARCLLRGCPDGGHANDQLKFPDRNDLIQSDNICNCLILSAHESEL